MSGGEGGGEPMLDIVRELAKLGGEVHANFTTVFKRLDRQDQTLKQLRDRKDDELTEIRTRLTKLETRRGSSAQARKRVAAAKWGAIAVAVVTILGGLSSAYHQGVELIEAIHKALNGGR